MHEVRRRGSARTGDQDAPHLSCVRMARRALVTGIGGQDGSYLAELLLGHGYEVFGTVLGSPEVREELELFELELTDAKAVASVIRELKPDEIYHLASASFVPASGEMFGAPVQVPQSEETPVAPITPYGAGKAFGHFLTGAFRRHHGVHASSAILCNHESPRRPEHFLSRKVSRGAAAISLGLERELRLGDLSAQRDWGFAGDYVRAMWLMLQADEPDDYVVATGEAHTVEDFVAAAFEYVGLDWREHVRYDESLSRGPSDSPALVGDPTKIRERLGWEPEVRFDELVRMMVDADLEQLRAQAAASAR